MIISLIAVTGNGFNYKEKIMIATAWIPKATVQVCTFKYKIVLYRVSFLLLCVYCVGLLVICAVYYFYCTNNFIRPGHDRDMRCAHCYISAIRQQLSSYVRQRAGCYQLAVQVLP